MNQYTIVEHPETEPRAITITKNATGEAETVTVNTTTTQHTWALTAAREYFENNPTILNYTPHDVHIIRNGETIATFPTKGSIRIKRHEHQTTQYYGIPVYQVTQDPNPSHLPAPLPYTKFIVSSIVAEAHPHRRDFITPHKLVKDSSNRIIGTEGFREQ